MGLIWRWWGLVGTEYGCVVQQVNDSTYILGFEDRGVPPMYVDLIVQVVVHKGGPKLVILQPTANSDNGPITHEPKMPTVTCRAQLQNYNGGSVTYDWMYATADTFLQKTPKGLPLPPRYSGIGFSGTTSATGSNVSGWDVPFDGLFIGGKNVLIVKATTSDGKTYSDTVYAGPILGNNPSSALARPASPFHPPPNLHLSSSPRLSVSISPILRVSLCSSVDLCVIIHSESSVHRHAELVSASAVPGLG